jgi:hypothetical protein
LFTGQNFAQFAMFQASSNAPAIICTFTTGNCVGAGGGNGVFTAATCDGMADTSPSWLSLGTFIATWQGAHTGLIELDIPAGSICSWTSLTNHGLWSLTDPPKNIVVVGYGATITNNSASDRWFYLGGFGEYFDNTHSARTAAASAGATCVDLLTPSQNTIFAVGTWAFMSGFDLQSGGSPTNPYYFDYVLVSGIDATHNCSGGAGGSISFSPALTNSYKTTWPLYDAGSSTQPDQGGPATLYQLHPSWNSQIEYRGVTIDTRNIAGQASITGRNITFRDVTFASTSCGVPSINLFIQYINTDMSGCAKLEVDKIIGQVVFTGSTFFRVDFTSSSTDLFTVTNSTISNGLVGTPKKAVISTSTIGNLEPGAYGFGRSNEIVCTTCTLTQITTGGVSESGTVSSGNWGLSGQSGGPYNSTMSGGTITIPNTHGAVTWAVPGTNFTWSYGSKESTFVYQVSDVTQDVTNTYVATNCVGSTTVCGSGGNLPAASGTLTIRAHPAPKFTCSGCIGNALITQYNSAPAAVPLYSYSQVVYDRTTPVSSTPGPDMWGTVSNLTFTVTGAYAGATNPYTFAPLYQFGYGIVLSGGSVTTYTPIVDLRTAGSRVITPSGVTGSGGADSGLTLPAAVSWMAGTSEPNISATTLDWAGTLTVTLTTNQGVVNP